MRDSSFSELTQSGDRTPSRYRAALADSARRVERAQIRHWAAPRGWSLPSNTTRAQLDQALLTIDVFPRAALILLIFEGIRIADATTLLDAKDTLVKKAQAIGLRDLTTHLAAKHQTPVQTSCSKSAEPGS